MLVKGKGHYKTFCAPQVRISGPLELITQEPQPNEQWTGLVQPQCFYNVHRGQNCPISLLVGGPLESYYRMASIRVVLDCGAGVSVKTYLTLVLVLCSWS